MRIKRYTVLIMLLLYGCFALAGCGKLQEQEKEESAAEDSVQEVLLEEEDELVFAVNVDSSTSEAFLDSVWMNRSKFWGGLVFQGLLIAEDNITNVRPELCEEYIISPDGTKYVFLLREDVYWHDGVKLTAEDVVWSVETSMRAGQVNGYIQKGLKNIKGAVEYQAGEADSVSGISVEGNAITIELTEKDSQFLVSIAQLAILPKHCLKNIAPEEISSADFWLQPIGSGPYKVELVEEGKEFLFVANENYIGKVPEIKKIRYKLLDNPGNEEFDFAMTSDPITVNKYLYTDKYAVRKTNDLYYRYLFFNLDGRTGDRAKLLQNYRIRQALVMALDKDAIIKKIYGEAAISIDGGIPSTDSWYLSKDDMGLTYQPELAKQMLEEEGFDFSQSIVLTRYHQDDLSVKLLDEIAKYWNNIGIKTTIAPIDASQTDRLWKDADWYDVCLKNLSAVDYSEWYYEYSTDNQLWSVVLHRSGFDSMIDALSNTSMAKEKSRLYYDVQKMEAMLVYKIPICMLPQYVIYNKEHIQIPDMEFPNMWFYFDIDIEEWKFKE